MLIHDATTIEKAQLRHRGFAQFEYGFMPTLHQEFGSLIQQCIGVSLQNG